MKGPGGVSYLSPIEADRRRSHILADKLPKLVIQRGLALCEIARQANIPLGRLNNLRNGRPLSKHEFARVAEALEVPVDQILSRRNQ
jgi:transcriptional regulator with XRE-family HTH domain